MPLTLTVPATKWRLLDTEDELREIMHATIISKVETVAGDDDVYFRSKEDSRAWNHSDAVLDVTHRIIFTLGGGRKVMFCGIRDSNEEDVDYTLECSGCEEEREFEVAVDVKEFAMIVYVSITEED